MHNFLENVVFPDDVTLALGDVHVHKADELITSLGSAIDKIPEGRSEEIYHWHDRWSWLQSPSDLTPTLAGEETPESMGIMDPTELEYVTEINKFAAANQLSKPNFKEAFIELYDAIAECYMRLEDGGQEPLASEKKALIILEELINLMDWPCCELHVWPKTATDDYPVQTWTPHTTAHEEQMTIELTPHEIIWSDTLSGHD